MHIMISGRICSLPQWLRIAFAYYKQTRVRPALLHCSPCIKKDAEAFPRLVKASNKEHIWPSIVPPSHRRRVWAEPLHVDAIWDGHVITADIATYKASGFLGDGDPQRQPL